jgi:hypothetical protein
MFLAALVAVAASAPAPDPEPRHEGFFLRMDLGFGWSWSFVSSSKVTGIGSGLGIGIGGNVGDNLALFGELFAAGTSKPRLDGMDVGMESLSVGGIGVGLTYYFMPQNVFVSTIAGVGSLARRQNSVCAGSSSQGCGTYTASDPGFIARAGIGKEWHVSRTWGLGIAGYLNLGINRTSLGETWNTVVPIVAFSATLY